MSTPRGCECIIMAVATQEPGIHNRLEYSSIIWSKNGIYTIVIITCNKKGYRPYHRNVSPLLCQAWRRGTNPASYCTSPSLDCSCSLSRWTTNQLFDCRPSMPTPPVLWNSVETCKAPFCLRFWRTIQLIWRWLNVFVHFITYKGWS